MTQLERCINLARLLGVPVRLIDDSTFATRRRNHDIATLAQKLGVSYIVDHEQIPLRTYQLKNQQYNGVTDNNKPRR